MSATTIMTYADATPETITLTQEKAILLHLEQEFKRNTLEIGKHLTTVRDLLKHNKQGGFEQWVDEELGWSRQSAYNYIKVYERFADQYDLILSLGLAPSTLSLLAENKTPEAARQEVLERAQQGEKITYNQAKATISTCRRSGKGFRGSGTPLGDKKHRKTDTTKNATSTSIRTLCVFCKRSDLRVYAFDASGSGICLHCAEKAVRELS